MLCKNYHFFLPLEPFFKSGVTSPNLTMLNVFTNSTYLQKVDFLIGETGTSSTRTRQLVVRFNARSMEREK